jgi:hypothetical protein
VFDVSHVQLGLLMLGGGGVGAALLVVAAAVFLVLIPMIGFRLLRMSESQLLDRLRLLGLSGLQVRLVLAGVGWGIAGVALSLGTVLAVTADATGDDVVETTAIVVLVIWVGSTLLAAITSVTGSPRVLRLPQFKQLAWEPLVRSLDAIPDA